MRRFFLVFFFAIFLLNPLPAVASENYATVYDATYTINDQGITTATYAFSLKNKTSETYPTAYSLTLLFDDLQNVQAKDAGGAITPVIEDTPSGKKVTLKLNKPLAGKEKVTNFSLSFTTTSIARKQGSIWEINIPGAKKHTFEDFTILVKTPTSLGEPTYVKPQPKEKKLVFTKKDLGESGISLVFGDTQYYAFTLTYHLKNSGIVPTTQTITFPSTTNYQDILLTAVDPKPHNVTMDTDGNWIAHYPMKPFATETVTVVGKAKVWLTPKKEKLTNEQLEKYLKPKLYWDMQDKHIQQLANTLQTPQAIYTYVVKTLTYDFSRVENKERRLGAVGALQNEASAVCLEFTDLFIAIARAAGIPAREVDGFAFTENPKQRPLASAKDILHVWPEYYDKEQQAWIMIDPTWGNTTGADYFHLLDLDHLTFVKKGMSSTTPKPAGAYKNDIDKKDIVVTFTDPFSFEQAEPDIQLSVPEKAMAGLPAIAAITVINTGKTILPSQTVTASFTPTNITQTVSFEPVPPFGSLTKNVHMPTGKLLTSDTATVTIRLGEKERSHTTYIASWYFDRNTIVIGGIIVVFSIAVPVIAAKVRRLSLFG